MPFNNISALLIDGERQTDVSPLGRRIFARRAFVSGASVAVLALALAGAPAWSQQLPTGGSVAAGNATIAQPNASTLNINQSTNQAILNWQSFSVGQGGTVNFNQPSSSSATLNRVLGSTPSSIAGTINAPGTVLLVNPNGITITKNGVINTGSFAASTLDIKDADFLSGNYKFTGNGGSAAVSNAGRINVSDGGFAALLGGQVGNSGVISARLGKVGLGAGELITLDFAGDGFLSVAVPSTQVGNLVDQNGALVTNSGKIRADGGQVFLSAATASTILRDAVHVPGSIRANTVGTREGRIVLGGGAGGKVNVTGKLAARTKRNAVAGSGGKIDVSGHDIVLAGARFDVSGASGGGNIRIGGDAHGGGTFGHAQTVSIDSASVIRADALREGDGGTVIVWSDGVTQVAGTLSARGANGGLGGFIETSGHTLNIGGIRVQAGPGGRWLLDPEDLTVDLAAYNAINAALAGSTDVELVTTATTATGFGTTSAGNGDIILTNEDAISWSTTATLTLNAYRNIVFNTGAAVSHTGAGGGLVLRADNTGTGDGTVQFASAGQVNFDGGGAVTIYYNPAGDSTAVNGTKYALGSQTDFSANVTAVNGATLTTNMLVNTIYDLQNVQNFLSGTYALARDIDASDTWTWNGGDGFVPVGTAGTPFTGAFDGQGHTISELTIDRPTTDDVGLFGYTSGGTVANVGLVDGFIAGQNNVGALVGTNNGGVITNSYATSDTCGCGGQVGGLSNVGGLVGQSAGVITGSHADVTVFGQGNNLGGLVGYLAAGSVSTSYATGMVVGIPGSFTINVGGLIGQIGSPFATVERSYATGSVEGVSAVGGLIGDNFGTVTESYATGNVRGQDRVGGLVGWNENGAILQRVYATGLAGPSLDSFGDFLDANNVGGLVGYNSGSITDAYATGAVVGSSSGGVTDLNVGGLIGFNDTAGSAENVYAAGFATASITGSLPSTINIGSIVGTNQGNINNAYSYDGLVVQPFGGVVGVPSTALPPSFDPVVWGIVSGISNPYFNWRFPNGPTVISGNVSGLGSDNGGQTIGLALNGTLYSGNAYSNVSGNYMFMVDQQPAGSAAITWLANESLTGGTSGYSNAIGPLAATAPGFTQGHASGLDLAPDRVLVLADSSMTLFTDVIGLMERAIYKTPGQFLSVLPYQMAVAGIDPFLILFDAAATPPLTSTPYLDFNASGLTYRLQSAAANFTINAPIGCFCSPDRIEVIGSGNLTIADFVEAGTSVLMTAPGNITIGTNGSVFADGTGDAIVLAAGSNFINSAGSGALTLTDPSSRWLIYSYNSYTVVPGGLDSGNDPVLNVTFASYPPAGVTELGNRYLFAVSIPPETPATPSSDNPPSQVTPPSNNPTNPGVNISFQNPAGGPINVSFTPAPRTASNNPGTDVSPASLPDGAALATNNGLSFLPISMYDANQYSQFALPGYADQAALSAVFTMIARGVDGQRASDYMIDTFWNGAAGAWKAGDPNLSAKVTFSDGLGNSVVPNGQAGFPIVAGTTDFAAMLKTGPVMISGGGNPAHWLLATQMTADGKGIVANDPVTGKQIVLAYDAATKTVGGVTGVFDGATKKFVPVAEAAAATTPADARLSALQGFVASSYLAVAVK